MGYPSFSIRSIPSLFDRPSSKRSTSLSNDGPLELTPEEEDSLLKSIKERAVGGLAATGHALSTPGDYLRGVLSGRTGERKTGREMLERWGVLGRNKPGFDAGDVAGFAAELPTDPLFWLSGGIGTALGTSGRIAKGAGLLSKGTDLSAIAKAAGKVSPEVAEKIGPRLFAMKHSLGDILKTVPAAERAAAEKAILRASAKSRMAGETVEEIAKGPMGGAMNFGAFGGEGMPFFGKGPLATLGHGPLAEKYASGMDTLGRVIRTSRPGRMAKSLFSQRGSMGARSIAGQKYAPWLAEQLDDIMPQAMEQTQRAERAMVAAGLNKEGGDEAIRQLAEALPGDVSNVQQQIISKYGSTPDALNELHGAIQGIRETRKVAEEYGVAPRVLDDLYSDYLHRHTAPGVVPKKEANKLGRLFGATSQERLARSPVLSDIQGGTTTISDIFKKLSPLVEEKPDLPTLTEAVRAMIAGKATPKVFTYQQLKRLAGISGKTVKELKEGNYDDLAEAMGKLGYQGKDRAESIARLLGRTPKDVRDAGFFVDHPLFNLKHMATAPHRNVAMAKYAGKVASEGLDERTMDILRLGSKDKAIISEVLKEVKAGKIKPKDFSRIVSERLGKAAPFFDPDVVPLRSVLRNLGAYGKNKYRAVAEQLGMPYTDETIEILKRANVKKEIADDLLERFAKFQAPKEAGELGKLIDQFTGTWTTGVTTHPAFTFRNLASANVKNMLSQLFSGAGTRAAAELFHGGLPDLKTLRNIPIVMEEAAKQGIKSAEMTAQQARDVVSSLASRYGVADQFKTIAGSHRVAEKQVSKTLDDWLGQYAGGMHGGGKRVSARSILGKAAGGGETTWNPKRWWSEGIEKMPLVAAAREANVFSEGQPRLAGWLKLVGEGVDPTVAQRLVSEAQFRYGAEAFTPFENKIMKRFMPFYKFGKQSSVDTIKRLAEAPGGRLGQFIRMQGKLAESGEDKGLIPDYISQSLSLPLPPGISGDPRYLTGFGLMHEQDPFAYMGGGIGDALSEAISRTNPLFKMPVELASGRSFFQRGPMGPRALEDLDPPIGRTLTNLRNLARGSDDQLKEPARLPALLEAISSNLPTSRAVTTARTLTDPRKGWIAALLNTLTGARVTDVPQRTRDALLRERVELLMKGVPGSKAFSRTYIPKSVLAEMGPEERKAAMQLQSVLNKLAASARERAKEEAGK